MCTVGSQYNTGAALCSRDCGLEVCVPQVILQGKGGQAHRVFKGWLYWGATQGILCPLISLQGRNSSLQHLFNTSFSLFLLFFLSFFFSPLCLSYLSLHVAALNYFCERTVLFLQGWSIGSKLSSHHTLEFRDLLFCCGRGDAQTGASAQEEACLAASDLEPFL